MKDPYPTDVSAAFSPWWNLRDRIRAIRIWNQIDDAIRADDADALRNSVDSPAVHHLRTPLRPVSPEFIERLRKRGADPDIIAILEATQPNDVYPAWPYP